MKQYKSLILIPLLIINIGYLYSTDITINLLQENCVRCHGGEKTKGSFDIKSILSKGVNLSHIDQWNKVYRVIKAGDMPPEDEKESLSIEQERHILSHLSDQLKTDKKVTRLMTADEFKYTISDLFGIDIDNDNQFDTLKGFKSPESYSTQQKDHSMSIFYLNEINRLFNAISKDYIYPSKPQYEIQAGDSIPLELNTVGFASESLIYSGNNFIDLRGQYNEHPTAFRIKNSSPPQVNLAPGNYLLKINISSHHRKEIIKIPEEYNQDNKLLKEPAKLSFYLLQKYHKKRPASEGKEKWLQSFYVSDHEINKIELPVNISKETALGFTFENGPTMSGIRRVFNKKNKYDQTLPTSPKRYHYPYLRFHEIKIVKTNDYKQEFCHIKSDSSLIYLDKLKTFVKKSGTLFKTTQIDLLFKQQLEKYKSHERAYLSTLRAIMLSADFQYLKFDPNLKESRYASYALLKSPPTQEFEQKYKKYLSQDITAQEFSIWLTFQPTFKRFIDQFTHEWLDLEEMTMNQPDSLTFNNFYEDRLQIAFGYESKAFVKNLFHKNLPIQHLIHSDYSFQNNSLKHFYNLPLNQQAGYYTQKSNAKSLRNGLIFQGAFLASTSNGVEALPFKRAKWISENILDRPIPDPPNNIDVEAFEATNGTFAEKMEAHRNNELCASCHKLLDPWAETMRYFDAIGQIEHKFNTDKVKVDVIDMKETLLKNSKHTATALCRNLVAYMTGRKNDIDDFKNIQRIVDDCKENGYRVRDLYTGIIKTYF